MQECKKCKTKLSSKNVLKAFLVGYRPFKCENCGSEFTFTAKHRLMGGAITAITVILALVLINTVELSNRSLLIAGAGTVVLLIALSLVCINFFKFSREN